MRCYQKHFILLSAFYVCFASAQHNVTDIVEFGIAHGAGADAKNLSKISVALFGNTVPYTVQNFVVLASRGLIYGPGDTVVKSYNGSLFHRVIPQFMIQGGDVTRGDGTGSISLYGKPPDYKFADENFQLTHRSKGCVAMANSGPDSNGSQFYITLVPTPHLDGKHVVFGKVIRGEEVIDKVAAVSTTPNNNRPVKPVWIYETRHIKLGQDQIYQLSGC